MATVVYQGSAAIDENGKAHGGAAGDQNGREVRIGAWYKHPFGWVVIRAKKPEHRAKIAAAMRAACANPRIGYDQYQRDTLYATAKLLGFDISKVAVPCETDCSALVRVCCAFAGIMVSNVPRFSTCRMVSVLKATGKFDVLTDPHYTDHSAWLMEGDILCTKTTGHTVVILNNGEMANVPIPEAPAVYYTVVRGDSWARIAKRNGMTRLQLMNLNGKTLLTARPIHPGDKLRIK